MKFETNNLVIMDNPNLENLIVPVGFFLNNNDENEIDKNSNMKLLNYIIKNSSTIDDNLYDKLFNLVDNNKLNKTKKNNIKKSKTKKNNIKKKKNKKTKRHIKLK